MTQSSDELAAKESADNNLECICAPDHFLYGTGDCWFHLADREQYQHAFLQGCAHKQTE